LDLGIGVPTLASSSTFEGSSVGSLVYFLITFLFPLPQYPSWAPSYVEQQSYFRATSNHKSNTTWCHRCNSKSSLQWPHSKHK
jgi:hypothetical protein